jgi:hypothetical protein
VIWCEELCTGCVNGMRPEFWWWHTVVHSAFSVFDFITNSLSWIHTYHAVPMLFCCCDPAVNLPRPCHVTLPWTCHSSVMWPCREPAIALPWPCHSPVMWPCREPATALSCDPATALSCDAATALSCDPAIALSCEPATALSFCS